MEHLEDAARFGPGDDGRPGWREHLRRPALSVGTYSLPAGCTDDQQPHTEDEVYVVIAGRGAFDGAGGRVEVGPGTTLYVPAREPHRFVDVTEDLTVVVLFAPAEGSSELPGPHA